MKIRLLRRSFRLPLEIAAGRHETTTALERLAEHRLFVDRLSARVDGLGASDLWIFRPVRDESPAKLAHRDHALAARANDRHDVGGRDVEAHWARVDRVDEARIPLGQVVGRSVVAMP
jgi:hypothetical protein